MRIALIIPTIGRPDDLRACLESIAREADSSLAQVIVVDDGCPQPVRAPALPAGPPVEMLRNEQRRGAAFCRNLAAKALVDEVDAIGFIDDDARLCPGWLTIANRELTRDRGAITGPVRRFDEGLVSRARQLRYDRRYKTLDSGQAVSFLAGGNALVWRDLFEKAGGFPEMPTMSDRFFVGLLEKSGARCHFVPELFILHRNSKGFRAAVREAWRAGLLDDTPFAEPPLRRLSRGLKRALNGPETAPALLNVFLDGVFLLGQARRDRRRDAAGAKGNCRMAGR